ncbi:MAG: hypothetical protein R3C02_01870 [Planctomycetaceae bacterium]
MGPIPHHMHQNAEQAALVGQEGKPESYYFPPQMNAIGNNFPYTFMGLEPGTTKQDVVDCLDRWNQGENGILDLSKAYRLKPGTGWLIPPCVLHAPGSLVTYEPQWGSDVFAMYQNLVEGREVPRALLTKDFPEEFHDDNQYLVDALDWDKNVDPNYKDSNYALRVDRQRRRGRLLRQVDRLRHRRRRATLHRQGTHAPAGRQMHDQRWRRLLPHHHPGQRPR